MLTPQRRRRQQPGPRRRRPRPRQPQRPPRPRRPPRPHKPHNQPHPDGNDVHPGPGFQRPRLRRVQPANAPGDKDGQDQRRQKQQQPEGHLFRPPHRFPVPLRRPDRRIRPRQPLAAADAINLAGPRNPPAIGAMQIKVHHHHPYNTDNAPGYDTGNHAAAQHCHRAQHRT